MEDDTKETLIFLRETAEGPFRLILPHCETIDQVIGERERADYQCKTNRLILLLSAFARLGGGAVDREGMVQRKLAELLLRTTNLASHPKGQLGASWGGVNARSVAKALLSPGSSLCVLQRDLSGDDPHVIANICDLRAWTSRAERASANWDGSCVIQMTGPTYDLGRTCSTSDGASSCSIVLDLGQRPTDADDIDRLLTSVIACNDCSTDEEQETLWMGIVYSEGPPESYQDYLTKETDRAYRDFESSCPPSEESERMHTLTDDAMLAAESGGKMSFLVLTEDGSEQTAVSMPLALLCWRSKAWDDYITEQLDAGKLSPHGDVVMDLTGRGITADQLRLVLDLSLFGSLEKGTLFRWHRAAGNVSAETVRAIDGLGRLARDFEITTFDRVLELYVLQNAGPGTWSELLRAFGDADHRHLLRPVVPWILLDRWDSRSRPKTYVPPDIQSEPPLAAAPPPPPSRPESHPLPVLAANGPWSGGDPLQAAARRLDVLTRIARNNRNRLDVTVSHPIDRKAMDRWTKKQGTRQLKAFARAVAQSLRHVGYAEFMATLQSICRWTAEWIRFEEQPPIVLLHLPGGGREDKDSVRKSNFWVSLLVLRDNSIPFSGVITGFSEAYETCLAHPATHVLVVSPDDAIYSGQQMLSNLAPDEGRLGRVSRQSEKPDPHLDRKEGKRIIQEVNDAGYLHVLPLVPFIAMPGLRLLNGDPRKMVFSTEGQFIQAAGEIDCVTATLTDPAFQEFASRRMGYGPNHYIIYFDHKMPDNVSTLQRILTYGDVFNKRGQVTDHVNFIMGCDVPRYPATDPWMVYPEHLLCPRAFYKTVAYVSEEEGKPLTDTNVAQLFRRLGIESPTGAPIERCDWPV